MEGGFSIFPKLSITASSMVVVVISVVAAVVVVSVVAVAAAVEAAVVAVAAAVEAAAALAAFLATAPRPRKRICIPVVTFVSNWLSWFLVDSVVCFAIMKCMYLADISLQCHVNRKEEVQVC